MAKHEEVKNGVIFPLGEKNEAYAQYFVGRLPARRAFFSNLSNL